MEDPSPILHWSTDGTAIVANEQLFEDKVMKRYPGLVQISSFLNYRRQLREYGFDWAVVQNGEFQFSHPCFIRGRQELIRGVTTKRKSYGGCHSHSTTEMTPSEGGASGGRGKCRTKEVSRLVNTSHSAPTQIEVVGVTGRRDDCGFADCAPRKIIKLSVGNSSGLRAENGVSPGSLDAWSLCSPSPSTQMKRFQLGDNTCNSDSSGRYPVARVYATRNSARLRELRDRMPDRLSMSIASSDADSVKTFPAASLTSPRSHDWWTYCAPWGPSEEGPESLSEAGITSGATGFMSNRYSFVDGYRPNSISIQVSQLVLVLSPMYNWVCNSDSIYLVRVANSVKLISSGAIIGLHLNTHIRQTWSIRQSQCALFKLIKIIK